MSSHFSSRKLFRQLDGESFSTYRDLEQRVRELYASNVESFPGEYSVDRLLDLGERKGWIVREEGGSYRVSFKQDRVKFKKMPA
jgi:hypothetical protein